MEANLEGHPRKFDMLRGIAAIAVLVSHVSATYVQRLLGSDYPSSHICDLLARHAVLVFFLLSGFLITNSIVANAERNGRFRWSEYLVARLARIYPPLIGAILLTLLASALIHGIRLPGAVSYGIPGDVFEVRHQFKVGPGDVARALLTAKGMLDADGPLWSLYLEFHIYIAVMFAALAAAPSRSAFRWIFACLAVAVWSCSIFSDSDSVFFSVVWLIGAAVSINFRWLRGHSKKLAALAWLIVAVYILIAVIEPGALIVDQPKVFLSWTIQLIVSFAYAYFIFISNRFARHPPEWLVKTGTISYSLYVIHFPLLLLLLSLLQTWMGSSMPRALAVSAIATVLVTAIAFRFARFFEDQRRFKPLVRTLLAVFLPRTGQPAQMRT